MRSTCSRPASRRRHDILPSCHERFTLGPARRPDDETIDELRRPPVRHETVTHVLGTTCYLCLRTEKGEGWRRGRCIPDSRITNDRFAPDADVPYSDWRSTLRVSRRRRVAIPGRLKLHPRFRKPPAPRVRILATLCGGTHYALHNGEFADRCEMKAHTRSLIMTRERRGVPAGAASRKLHRQRDAPSFR
jgi:hypothetical protein